MAVRRKPRGNEGKGRPKGSKNKRTKELEMEESVLRSKIRERMDALLDAQFANAQGIKFLVVRERKGGKFVKVHEAMARGAQNGKLGKDEEIIEVWEKDPSVNAFKELLDRGYGKAKEAPQEIEGSLTIRWEK